MAADLIVTAAHDAIHVVGTPAVPVTYVSSTGRVGGHGLGTRVDGAPSVSVCGQRAIVSVNRRAADSLYSTLGDCPACHA